MPTRILPMMVLVGGVTFTAANFGTLLDSITDRIKVLVTSSELGTIRQTMESAFVPPDGRDPEAFRNFLRENLRGRSGDRDPALDFWGSPYELLRLEGDAFVVVSCGPNGGRDCCRDVNGPAEVAALVQMVEGALDQERRGELTYAEEEDEADCDDVCVALELRKSDSPFRRLR